MKLSFLLLACQVTPVKLLMNLIAQNMSFISSTESIADTWKKAIFMLRIFQGLGEIYLIW